MHGDGDGNQVRGGDGDQDGTAPAGGAVDELARRLMAGLPFGQAPVEAVTALAARHLLTPGVVTAAVIGGAARVASQLDVLTRDVPDVSHVSVRLLDGRELPPALTARLALDGVELSCARSAAEAAFGANLVVVTDPIDPGHRPRPPRLSKGAVLVNASGTPLPPVLLAQAHRVFVDDPAQRDTASGDLRQVLVGGGRGRTDADHVLLVELLSPPPPGGLPVSIENEVAKFVVTTFAQDLTPDQLPHDLDLLDNGVVDSLGLLRLIAWVGERYEIPVEEQGISPADFSSVEAIAAFVRNTRSLV
ncbi:MULTISPECIES: hypothetical protein [Actinosynnema]|uniref:hypothetical protein n=1 Tax=Actinosynnema TaxID=40566 RepID=UPI0020A3D5DC|nr:hypothetical protein [Actinosynnema pretiosum]MCP2092466.1 Ornithine cyclodeaminase/mu-crystallin family protein [Actinosynnema pretiosum]